MFEKNSSQNFYFKIIYYEKLISIINKSIKITIKISTQYLKQYMSFFYSY